VPKGFVSAAVVYLREHIHDTVYTADLIRHLGFSRTRVFDMFKAQTGHTPNEYLQRLRIEKAEELLRQTNRSVTEIALATGFGSGQHFSLVFRRYTGFSPACYRGTNRRG
jgi:transcriptional regulator GlxA family with amidase domain